MLVAMQHPLMASAYSSPQPQHFPYSDLFLSHHPMHNQQSMQPPPSPGIPIDPALALYPPYYSTYHPPHIPQHLSLPPNYSSPSSQGSDTIGTPPTEHMYPSSSSNLNGKRPSSSVSNSTMNDSRKKARKDEGSEAAHSPMAEKEEVKAKPTRGSRRVFFLRSKLAESLPIALFSPSELVQSADDSK